MYANHIYKDGVRMPVFTVVKSDFVTHFTSVTDIDEWHIGTCKFNLVY